MSIDELLSLLQLKTRANILMWINPSRNLYAALVGTKYIRLYKSDMLLTYNGCKVASLTVAQLNSLIPHIEQCLDDQVKAAENRHLNILGQDLSELKQC